MQHFTKLVHAGLYLILSVLLVACGSGGSSKSSTTSTTTPVTRSLTLFAGNMGGTGSTDGTGPTASFFQPQGVATDSAGNVYVADTYNNTIRKITPAGVVTTLTDSAGLTIGTETEDKFNYPTRVTTDSTGNVYVANTNGGAIHKITPSGAVSTLAVGLNGPRGIAVDSTGNVYVAETYNNAIRKITPTGVVTTLAGKVASYSSGSADGIGVAATFSGPMGVTIDYTGNVYVADTYNNTIRKITAAGVVTTLAGTAHPYCIGSADGTGATAVFCDPTDVATDNAGNVYVAEDSGAIRKITPAGVVTTLAGNLSVSGFADGTGASASFDGPSGIATDSVGNVYVGDRWNNNIRKITSAGEVTTLAGVGGRGASYGDGMGLAASFYNPTGVATDSSGNVYVADTSNSTIRKITPTGVVTTLAGTTGAIGSADGRGAAAKFNAPNGVATDSANNIYVADNGNHTIRKITPSGVVTTLAGLAGVSGSADGNGATARFFKPTGVATDKADNIYVTDEFNFTIRKIAPSGMVTTLAGVVGVTGHADGTGTAASFNYSTGIATDSTGNVYVVDTFNHTIRKITKAGVVTTLAGKAGVAGSADGTGAAARFYNPTGIVIDGSGNAYVADSGNNTIRKITPDRVVSTVVGVAGQLGFSTGALPGVLWHPSTIAFSGSSLYITTKNGVAVVTNVP